MTRAERGEHQPPDPQVLVVVGEQDRARPGHRPQRPGAAAAPRHRRIGRVDGADRLGMPDEHQRRVIEGEAQGEGVRV